MDYTAKYVEVAAALPGDAYINNSVGLIIPTRPGRTVYAGIDDSSGELFGPQWRASIFDSPERLEEGPLASVPSDEVVEWLRRVCDAEPDDNVRTYVIGLPVVITVHPDGRVEMELDMSEASDLRDDSVSYADASHPLFEQFLDTDIRRIEAAVAAGTVVVS